MLHPQKVEKGDKDSNLIPPGLSKMILQSDGHPFNDIKKTTFQHKTEGVVVDYGANLP